MVPFLKIYREPAAEIPEETYDSEGEPDVIPLPTNRVSLRDLLPLVSNAQKRHFIWLQDFLDDEVCISNDLLEILHEIQGSRPA
ncbi:MAG: hypothetical protein R3B84_19730 [Zavarzinella sp.]